MSRIPIETNWLISLNREAKLLFLTRLAHGITIAGRNSYVPGSDELENPTQLRKINEIQHRVLGCLLQLMQDEAYENIYHSIANCVLNESEPELHALMFYTWQESKGQL